MKQKGFTLIERGTHKPEVSGSESLKHNLNCKLL